MSPRFIRNRWRFLLAIGAGLVLAAGYFTATARRWGLDDAPQVTVLSRFSRLSQEGVWLEIRAPKRRVLDVRQICTQRGPYRNSPQTVIPQGPGGFTLHTPIGAYFKLSPGASTQYCAWGLGRPTIPEALSPTGQTRLAVFAILENHRPSWPTRLSLCWRLKAIHPLFQQGPLTESVLVLADPITNAIPVVNDDNR